jgi:hypothetical protein
VANHHQGCACAAERHVGATPVVNEPNLQAASRAHIQPLLATTVVEMSGPCAEKQKQATRLKSN